MSCEEVINVAEKNNLKKFFPMPFFLSANEEDFKSFKITK